jgi:glycosyltransferase involved in cell wall biosynthesis
MITLAITTYQRDSMVIEAIQNVLDDDRISEIVIVDDASDYGFYQSLQFKLNRLASPKIKLFRNKRNLDCYKNKREAVSKATNEGVILLDSDNIIDKTYVDSIFLRLEFKDWNEYPEFKKCILTPQRAMPHFDFSDMLDDNPIDRTNVAEVLNKYKIAEVMLNACNFFVNRDEYLKVHDASVDPVTSDSIYFMLKWFEAGNYINVNGGMNYTHRIHSGSHYQTNVKRTPKGFHQEVLNKLKALK